MISKTLAISSIFLLIFLTSCAQNMAPKDNEITNIPSVISAGNNTDKDSNQPSVNLNSTSNIGNQSNLNTGINATTGLADENGCFDSDGGLVGSVSGYVIDTKGETHYDTCMDDNVNEASCNIIGYLKETVILCKDGCVNGACRTPEPWELCNDSDGGKNTDKYGEISYMNKTYNDTCKGSQYIIEQYCTSIGVPGSEQILCVKGCINGQCAEEDVDNKEGCIDPDFGNESIYIKTTLIDPKGNVTDTCMNSYTVQEYKCGIAGFRTSENKYCPNNGRCVDGACTR